MARETTEDLVTWNSDTTYALGLYRVLTSILGIWPPKCQDVFSKIQVGILVFLQISMLVCLIGEVINVSSAINNVVEVIALLSCAVLALLKVVVLRGFHPKMLELISAAVEDWAMVKSSKARKIMMRHARLGRCVCIFQMTSAYATTIPMILRSLLIFAPPVIDVANGTNRSETPLQRLPLGTDSIFGDMSDFIYTLVFALQVLQLLTTCTGNIGNDVYFFGVTMHLCGQFDVLGEDLKSFEIDVDESVSRKKTVELVERHVRLGKLANYLEDCFNFIILIQLSANSLQMCLMGIQMILSLKLGDTLTVVNTIIVIYVMGLQLFLYSYAGDRLSSQIDYLRVSAYFLPWYDLPPRLAKDVLIMIMRSHKSFAITAENVASLSIQGSTNCVHTGQRKRASERRSVPTTDNVLLGRYSETA